MRIKTHFLRVEWFPTWRTHSGYEASLFVPLYGRWYVGMWVGPLAVEIGHRP